MRRLLPAAGELPPPPAAAVAGAARHRSDRAWLERLAATEKAIPRAALGDDELLDVVAGVARSIAGDLADDPAERCLRCCAAPAIRTTRPVGRSSVEGAVLHAADHARPARDRHARAPARRRGAPSRPARGRARRAGDPGAVRRQRPRGRRRISARASGSTAPMPGRAPARASAREVRARARGDPRRRRLQHAAAADALGHRAGAMLERTASRCAVDLPGVGRNLQDRYEVGVVNRMSSRTGRCLEGARFARDDPLYREWAADRDGIYTTNGAVLGVITRSAPERAAARPLLHAAAGALRRLLPGLCHRARRGTSTT